MLGVGTGLESTKAGRLAFGEQRQGRAESEGRGRRGEELGHVQTEPSRKLRPEVTEWKPNEWTGAEVGRKDRLSR